MNGEPNGGTQKEEKSPTEPVEAGALPCICCTEEEANTRTTPRCAREGWSACCWDILLPSISLNAA